MFALLPKTNGTLQDNVADRTISSTTANLIDVKIDHDITDKHRISGGFDFDNTKTGGTSILGPIFGSHLPQKKSFMDKLKNLVKGDQ